MPREQREPRRPRRDVFIPRECKLCEDQIVLDYKQPDLLRKFMTERGKILSRRLTGNCAMHQRDLTTAIKRARAMLLVR
jgi:small subunit ribosomal protein S18